MKSAIGAALVAGALVLAGLAAIQPAAAESPQKKPHSASTSGAAEFSAQRRYRRNHGYGYRPYDRPYYYARPSYYRPYPYSVPVPFVFGFGFGPYW